MYIHFSCMFVWNFQGTTLPHKKFQTFSIAGFYWTSTNMTRWSLYIHLSCMFEWNSQGNTRPPKNYKIAFQVFTKLAQLLQEGACTFICLVWAKFSLNIFRWINRHLMLKSSWAHIVQSYPVWVYAHLFVSPKLKHIALLKAKRKFNHSFFVSIVETYQVVEEED